MREGLRALGADPEFATRGIAYQLQDPEASFLVAGEDGIRVGMQAADEVGFKRNRIFVSDDGLFLRDIKSGEGG